MFSQELLVVTTSAEITPKHSIQIESIVNSLEIAVDETLINNWGLFVLPSSNESQLSFNTGLDFRLEKINNRGSIFIPAEASQNQSFIEKSVEQYRNSKKILLARQGTVFAPNTVSELLKNLGNGSDLLATQSYPINVGVGSQSATSLLLASERSKTEFIDLFKIKYPRQAMTIIIKQIIELFSQSISNVITAKTFDTDYSYGITRNENV